jgi:hypothetical protein
MSSRSVSIETPSHVVSSFDRFVTQWMSVRTSSLGRASKASQLQVFGSPSCPTMEKDHSSSGV